jgi:hypothetical protein
MARLNRVFAINLSTCPRLVAANCGPLPPLPSPPLSHTSSNTCVRLESDTSRHERPLLVSSCDAANRPVAERRATQTLHHRPRWILAQLCRRLRMVVLREGARPQM